jgi:hypothetical protein
MKCRLKLSHANSEKIAVQNLNIHCLQENYYHPHENSYSPINLEKNENHEKMWFSECVNKKTMKKCGFREPRFFKIALTLVTVLRNLGYHEMMIGLVHQTGFP